MDKFRIDDQFENNLKKEKQLTNEERKAFENELDEINRLIEENLGNDSEITETKTRPTIDTQPVKRNSLKDTIADKGTTTDQAEWQRQQQQRLNILNQDPTNRNKKAAGEDI